jgi:PAS domain S-box-containing protein
VWVTSDEGHANYSNQHWLALTGMSMEQSLGLGWTSAIHPDDVEPAMKHWATAASLKRTFEAEYRVRTPDGSYRWQLARATPYKNEGGGANEWFGTCTDIHDHKLAMKSLEEREATLRNFYDHSPFAMGISELLSNDVMIVYGNPAACEMYGVNPNADSGYTLRGLGAGEQELERSLEQHRKCLEAGHPVASQYLREGRGEKHWYRETLAPLDISATGNPRFTFVVKNITEQKLAEEALRRNEQQFQMALKNSPVAAFHQDKDLRYTWIRNPALGYKAEEVIGKRDSEIFENPEDAAITERLKRSVLETGCNLRTEVCVHYQGTPGYYDLTIEPIRNVLGEIEGVSCTATDVTIRKKAEDAFRQQQLILETLIESSRDYIYMKDRQGRYVFINTAAAQAIGKLPQEIIGKDDTCIFSLDDARKIMEMERRLMDGGTAEVVEETLATAHGMRTLQTSKGVCRDARGEIIGVVGISRDITEAKSAEDNLRAIGLAKAASQMGHALAHEINNPLAALTNTLYLMQYGSEALPADQLLAAAQDSLGRITKITRQMIGLYRQKGLPELIRVADVVEETLRGFSSRIYNKQLVLEKRLNSAEFNGIEADVRQVVTALLENAIEKGNKTIKIRLYPAKRPQTGFRLLIADDGPGIAPKDREKVFEPFYSTKDERGSGLGLWMTQRIAERYHGSVRLRSSNIAGGSGTCVVLRLSSLGGELAMAADTTIKPRP